MYYMRLICKVLGMWDATYKKLVVVRIPDRSGGTMVPVIKYFCSPGIRINTDGWQGYMSLALEGYQHLIVIHKQYHTSGILGKRVLC